MVNFLTEIQKNNELRSLFGERELKIIEKQILGIKLKPSEKTRLSRDIRKKFNAIKILIPYVDKFDLKRGDEIKRIIEETKELIFDTKFLSRIKKIILFGSATENSLTFRSDIDIAVYFTEITEEEAFQFRRRVLGSANKRVDIEVYNVLPNKIKKEIDLKGKVIYEKKNKRED